MANSLRAWLKKDDVLVVDRGFRDCIDYLEEMDIIAKMPHFLENQKQHSTEEANESRLVTSVRWVVEAINGLLKTFKALDHVMPNSQIPYIGDYVRIVASICNAFRPPRVTDDPSSEVIAKRMLMLSKSTNELQSLVEKENWSRKKVIWQEMDGQQVEDFPRLTVDELKQITFGVYQLKQARSYTEEHLDEDGLYKIFTHKEASDIVRVKIQSRHTASKEYNLWIRYHLMGITSWYCQCKAGARVVGCCAHVASVLWFLSHYRHEQSTPKRFPSKFEDNLEDAATGWSDEDSDPDLSLSEGDDN